MQLRSQYRSQPGSQNWSSRRRIGLICQRTWHHQGCSSMLMLTTLRSQSYRRSPGDEPDSAAALANSRKPAPALSMASAPESVVRHLGLMNLTDSAPPLLYTCKANVSGEVRHVAGLSCQHGSYTAPDHSGQPSHLPVSEDLRGCPILRCISGIATDWHHGGLACPAVPMQGYSRCCHDEVADTSMHAAHRTSSMPGTSQQSCPA